MASNHRVAESPHHRQGTHVHHQVVVAEGRHPARDDILLPAARPPTTFFMSQGARTALLTFSRLAGAGCGRHQVGLAAEKQESAARPAPAPPAPPSSMEWMSDSTGIPGSHDFCRIRSPCPGRDRGRRQPRCGWPCRRGSGTPRQERLQMVISRSAWRRVADSFDDTGPAISTRGRPPPIFTAPMKFFGHG